MKGRPFRVGFTRPRYFRRSRSVGRIPAAVPPRHDVGRNGVLRGYGQRDGAQFLLRRPGEIVFLQPLVDGGIPGGGGRHGCSTFSC